MGEPISMGTAMLGSSAISGGTSLLSGLMGSGATKGASQTQAMIGMMALMDQINARQAMEARLKPFVDAGTGAVKQLQLLTGTNEGGNPLTAFLTRPFQPTMQELEATPGYQFVKDQGLKTVANSYAAKGLSSSGAALKGAARYATGLADSTFENRFADYLKQNSQIFGMLSGPASLGENAAAQTGNMGLGYSQMIGNSLGGIGSALAGRQIGSTNALIQGMTGAGNALASVPMMYALGSGGMFSGGGTSAGNGMSVTNTNALYPGAGFDKPYLGW